MNARLRGLVVIRELFVELGEATIAAITKMTDRTFRTTSASTACVTNKAQADEHDKNTQKAFLDGPRVPRYSLYDHVNGIVGIMHETLGDRTLRVERDPQAQALIFSYRCKLCNKRHRARVDEPMFVGAADAKAFVDLLYNEVEALLQRPCNIELGKKT